LLAFNKQSSKPASIVNKLEPRPEWLKLADQRLMQAAYERAAPTTNTKIFSRRSVNKPSFTDNQ
jgi:hypothetical protein